MIHKKIVYLIIALGLSLVSTAQQTPAPKQQKSVLIINAKAHIGNGTVLENSAIGFKNGKIDLVSNDKNIAVSNYETVIDAKGKEIYPGFIAPNSTLGLVEIDAEMSRRLNQEAAKAVKYGDVSEEEAWKFVTLNPAKLLLS